ncbi:MAG: arsenic transporter [Acidobacteriota bacterium]|nr:arsenic transporter [Acidobacteriota bacterium]
MHALIGPVALLSLLLMLLRPRRIAEVWWVGGGAALLLLTGAIPWHLAAAAVTDGSDVYLFLVGMMLLAELAREQGVFDWLAGETVHHARGSTPRLLLLVYGAGVLVTVFLSNDATAVVLTPAILAATRRARVTPLPHLLACALVANAASFVLPISNPANLVVFHHAMPPLHLWLAEFAWPSILTIVVTLLLLQLLFRKTLAEPVQDAPERVRLQHGGLAALAGIGLTVVVLLVASARGAALGMPTCLAAIGISAAIYGWQRANPLPLLAGISWSTLALVAALFVMVRALEQIGALGWTSMALHWAAGRSNTAAVLLTAFTVGVGNNLVNNLPLGLLTSAALHAAHVTGMLASAALLGIDIGPNLSVTGSLATILWLIALRRENVHISAWDFLRAGALIMPLSLLAACAGLLMQQGLAH